MRTALLGACLGALSSLLPAQELGDAAAADTPLVRIDVLGPAAWRTRFLPTNLGSLLSSAAGEKLLQPLLERFEALWLHLPGDERKAARARFLDFGGRATLGVWSKMVLRGQPQVYGALAIDCGTDGDQAQVAADLARWLQLLPQRAERELGGQQFTVARNDDVVCTLPKTIAGRVVVLLADVETDLTAAAQRALPWLAAPAAPAAGTAALSMTLDLEQAWTLDPNLARAGWFAPLGLASLGDLTIEVGADGPHVKGEFALRFRDGERGLFACLFPERAGVPALGDLVPPTATGWKVGRLDLPALWRTALATLTSMDGQTEADLIEQAKRECNGVDPGKELLARLRDEVLVLWDDAGQGADASARELSVCLALPVTEEKAFREALAKMLAASDLEVSDVDGVLRTTQDENWLFPATHLAVGRGLAFLALGDAGGAQIDAILARARGRTPAAPEQAARWQRRAPAGFNSIGTLGLDSFLRYHLDFMLEGVDEVVRVVPVDAKDVADAVQQLLPLLAEHDLMRVVTLTGCAAGRWSLRVLW